MQTVKKCRREHPVSPDETPSPNTAHHTLARRCTFNVDLTSHFPLQRKCTKKLCSSLMQDITGAPARSLVETPSRWRTSLNKDLVGVVDRVALVARGGSTSHLRVSCRCRGAVLQLTRARFEVDACFPCDLTSRLVVSLRNRLLEENANFAELLVDHGIGGLEKRTKNGGIHIPDLSVNFVQVELS